MYCRFYGEPCDKNNVSQSFVKAYEKALRDPEKCFFHDFCKGNRGKHPRFRVLDLLLQEIGDDFLSGGILRKKDKEGNTIAHILAERGAFPKRFMQNRYLRLANKKGDTVAHWLASNGALPLEKQTLEILSLRTNSGSTVAHSLVRCRKNGIKPENGICNGEPVGLTEQVMTWADNYGWTVAHELAINGDVLFPERFMTDDILRLRHGKSGNTTAHLLAKRLQLPDHLLNDDLLRLTNNERQTVAHILAERGFLPLHFLSEDLLLRADEDGKTVAHEVARNGLLPEQYWTDEILRTVNGQGTTVAYFVMGKTPKQQLGKLMKEEILQLPGEHGCKVMDSAAYRGILPSRFLSVDRLRQETPLASFFMGLQQMEPHKMLDYLSGMPLDVLRFMVDTELKPECLGYHPGSMFMSYWQWIYETEDKRDIEIIIGEARNVLNRIAEAEAFETDMQDDIPDLYG